MNKFHFLILWNVKSIINHLPKSSENFCIIYQNRMILAEELLIYMGKNGFLSVMNLTSISLFAWIRSSNSSLLELNYKPVSVEWMTINCLKKVRCKICRRFLVKIIGKATLPIKNINNNMLHNCIKGIPVFRNFIHKLVVNFSFLMSNLSYNS